MTDPNINYLNEISPINMSGNETNILPPMALEPETGNNAQPFDTELIATEYESKSSVIDRTGRWIHERRARLALGVVATSAFVTLTTNPVSELKDDVIDAAPWVVGGVAASEVAFVAGGTMMLGAIGSKIGNPFKIKERIPEISQKANDSSLFKSGFWLNATGAVGDFAVISAGVLKELPPSTYPILSLTLLDLAGTIAVRKAILSGIRDNVGTEGIDGNGTIQLEKSQKDSNNIEKKRHKSHVRPAQIEDLDRLAEIDLMMFENAYGVDLPTHEESREMIAKRLMNISDGSGHMYVCEVDGKVEGFGTYFRTNKPWDEFVNWEKSTSEGTLDGVTAIDGEYAYVVNMTITPKGSEVRSMQKILMNLMSHATAENIKHAYFVSRIPEFTKWLESNGYDHKEMSEEALDGLAQKYVELTSVSKRGKEEPIDYELRTYTRSGFEMGELVKGGFSDNESLDYGVTFKVPIIGSGKSKALRNLISKTLRIASRSTKLMSKI